MADELSAVEKIMAVDNIFVIGNGNVIVNRVSQKSEILEVSSVKDKAHWAVLLYLKGMHLLLVFFLLLSQCFRVDKAAIFQGELLRLELTCFYLCILVFEGVSDRDLSRIVQDRKT